MAAIFSQPQCGKRRIYVPLSRVAKRKLQSVQARFNIIKSLASKLSVVQ